MTEEELKAEWIAIHKNDNALNDRVKKAWMRSGGWKPAKGNWTRLLPPEKKKTSWVERIRYQFLPGDDHVSLWRNKEGELLWLSQPYHLTTSTIKEMTAFAEAHDLEFFISSSPSWYYRAGVLSVHWTQKKDPRSAG